MTATLRMSELYKGDYALMVQLRRQLEEIARTLGLVAVLIEGAPVTGKTTMARVLSMVDPQYHRLSVEHAVREVREGAALKWYRDISLAGLTDTLADGQLFGVGKDIATEVGESGETVADSDSNPGTWYQREETRSVRLYSRKVWRLDQSCAFGSDNRYRPRCMA